MIVERFFKVADRVLRGGAYLGEALNEELQRDPRDAGALTAFCYGLFDSLIRIDFVLDQLVERQPKPVIRSYLRAGTFLVRESDMPAYAAVSQSVEALKKLGKGGAAGFVNAVLKKAAAFELKLPKDRVEALSVKYAFPAFAVRRYLKEYGEAQTERLLSFRSDAFEPIRINGDFEEFCDQMTRAEVPFRLSERQGCVFADYAALLRSGLDRRRFTKQNIGSARIADLCPPPANGRILDCCAAPGGKTVLLAERFPNAEVTACDLHPHRVELIRAYAARMGLRNVKTEIRDAAVFEPAYEGAFSTVLCDAPCSGFGVAYSKPDIRFFRREEDLGQLAALQKRILQNVSRYVAPGGSLIYATCTLFSEENEEVCADFLADHSDFASVRTLKLLPGEGESEGFFGQVFLRKEEAGS